MRLKLGTSQRAPLGITLLLVAGMAISPALGGATAGLPWLDVGPQGLLDQAAAAPATPVDALVVFEDQPSLEDGAMLRSHGLTLLGAFPTLRTIHVAGPGQALVEASRDPAVAGVFENGPIELELDTATLATNARNIWDDKSTSTEQVVVDGEVVDGSGVGIAVIDTGVDGTHPDLADAVVKNMRWLCATPVLVETASGYQKCFANWQINTLLEGEDLSCLDSAWTEMPTTDLDSGHGTHVASVAASRGEASDGRYTGVAPGAAIYGFGIGHATSMQQSDALAAFTWILCMHDEATPEIRVVNMSWGIGAGAFNSVHPIAIAMDAVVAEGIVVVSGVGNGGSGAGNTVGQLTRNPTPGVIGVANYDDGDVASIEGQIHPGSSRCLESSEAVECPDIAAPGTAIRAAQATTGAITLAIGHPLSDNSRLTCCAVDPANWDYLPWYVGVTGSSFATPHVSAAVALLLQANPELTPAEVEDILEDSAHAFASADYTIPDPTNPTSPVSPTAGHGLVDAAAALGDPRVLDQTDLGTELPKLGSEPHVYTETPVFRPGPAPLTTVRWAVPAGQSVTLSERAIVSGDPISTPLDEETPCRFLLDQATLVPCDDGTLVPEPQAGGFQMRAQGHVLQAPGDHRIEAQVDVGAGFVSFDAFTVRVVPPEIPP